MTVQPQSGQTESDLVAEEQLVGIVAGIGGSFADMSFEALATVAIGHCFDRKLRKKRPVAFAAEKTAERVASKMEIGLPGSAKKAEQAYPGPKPR